MDELARRHGQHWEVHQLKHGGEDHSPAVSTDLFAVQMEALLERAHLVRRANLSTDVPLITERCMASDCAVLARALHESGLLSARELAVHNAWSSSLGSALPDGVVYIDRHGPDPAAIDEKLRRAYEDWLQVVRHEGRAVVILSGTLSLGEMVEQVNQFIARLCASKRLSLDIMEVL